jgi:hypothetical protein
MNRISIFLPNEPYRVWADEGIAGLVGQTTTVLDLQGQKHPGRIASATRAGHGVEVIIETEAEIPGSDEVLGLSIGKGDDQEIVL